MKLVQVKAPHFTAGFVSNGKQIVEAAPILKYMVGKGESWVRHYIKQKGWTASVVSDTSQDQTAETFEHVESPKP